MDQSILYLSIVIITSAIMSIISKSIRSYLLEKEYQKGSMYIDTYERKKEDNERVITILGGVLLLGIISLLLSLILSMEY